MQAWPIEDAFVIRPLGSLALAAFLPVGSDMLLSRLGDLDASTLARARVPVRATSLALAWALGATALGPSLAEAPGGIVSHAAATLCLATAVLADRARVGTGDSRALAIGTIIALALSAGLSLFTPHGVMFGALVIGVAGAVAFRPEKTPADGAEPAGTWIGAAVAATLVGVLALPIPLTLIRLEDAPHAGDSTWRLRIDPWDENAMLANGWAARRRGDLDRATESAQEAVRMGLNRGPALELEAEVLAARGQCEAARAVFDQAIRARARDAFDENSPLAPLVLGGYQLPPTLVSECDGLDALPSFEDLRLQ